MIQICHKIAEWVTTHQFDMSDSQIIVTGGARVPRFKRAT